MAVRALKKEGYRILERNYRNPFGEIDVVAEDKDCLVFVEVKKRNTELFDQSVWSVNKRKRDHLVRTALLYLKTHGRIDRRARFDVVGIDGDRLKLIKDAFPVEDDRR